MSDDLKRDLGQVPDEIGSTNRGNDTAANNTPAVHITLESINQTIMEYFKETIIPTVVDNGQSRPVQIMYGTPERWNAVRKEGGVLRDSANDKLLAPLIMLRRSSVKPGKLNNPNNKYLYRTASYEWNERNSYDRFAVQNNIRPSLKFRNIMIPDYMDLTYDVVMWTEYQEQMDTLIEQINVENYEFWGQRNNYKFQVSIEEFQGESELPASKDRIVRTQFTMNIHSYLLPERVVQNFKLAATNTEGYSKKKIVILPEFVTNLKK